MTSLSPTVDVFTQIKKEAEKRGCSEKEIIRTYVKQMNSHNSKRYNATPVSERIVLLPQCLRQSDCKAPLREHGYECQHCNPDCQVNQISKAAKDMGYKGVYILPGGSIVEKIIEFSRPNAILGIACEKEALLGGLLLEKLGLIGRAILLVRDGCVNTLVKIADVLSALGIPIKKNVSSKP